MWRDIQAGKAKRMVLDDGTKVIALLTGDAESEEQVVFFSDVADLERLEFESEKLGSLSDMIDVLHPKDIIEICCRIQKDSKAC
jgi:hypothetical protein